MSSAVRLRLRRSVFTKLLGIMLGMGLVIPLAVGVFFVMFVGPIFSASAESTIAEYCDLFAATSPSLEAARQAAARHRVQMRFEGPRGAWTTSDDLPSIADAKRAESESNRERRTLKSGFRLVTRPDGASYLFVWDYRRDLQVAHDRMLVILLCLLVTIVLAAHLLLRRALRPLRWLHEGVVSLSEKNLEVAVPRRSSDEFGQLAEAFNGMVGRVRDMVRSRDQLLLDVSHELRSPITRMKVALELSPENDQKRTFATNLAQLESMVTELLELERLRQGRGLRVERIDLVRLVRETVEACADNAPGVELGSIPSRALIEADGEKIRSVLSNLLENAAKYALSNSRPTVVSVAEHDEAVVVTVRDDGPGIPPEDLPSIFEPFFRVDRSRSRRTGGYGLGLSLCERVMLAHAGTISVTNNPGHRGATFILHLPRRRGGSSAGVTGPLSREAMPTAG